MLPPRLLVLALSLPEVSYALGLGAMRIESRLNEPLSAQIDVIGATAEELQAIRASVASPELFQRFNAERPAFLSSATISVGVDATGKPVLNVHSTAPFTEPLVELLIDLRSGGRQLVRDYPLLLDPAHITPATPALVASADTVADEMSSVLVELPQIQVPEIVLPPIMVDADATPNPGIAPPPATSNADRLYRVVAHDTLRGIARSAGARSEADLQRTMLAIFQSNPQAFAGNVNRLHSGALIRIPSPPGIQVFDGADVERELRGHRVAWRGRSASRRAIKPSVAGETSLVVVPALPARDIDPAKVLSELNKLDGQVQFLRQTLGETSRQLASANARIADMERRAAQQPVVTSQPRAESGKPASGGSFLGSILGALALTAGALAYARRRFMPIRAPAREVASAEEPTVEAPVAEPIQENIVAEPTDSGITVELSQVTDIDVDTIEEPAPVQDDEPDTVVLEELAPQASDATGTVLDYNLADLDGRAQHVEMPDTLRDRPVLVERRKNVVDTLMAAVKRDPTRSDLRMKLLETLYAAAATHLRVFKDVVREVTRHPERLNAEQWEQVMMMGRQIAPDDSLFADQSAESKVADCA